MRHRGKSKFLHCAVIILLGAVMAAGCTTGKPRYRIGVSQPSSDAWRSQMNEEIQRELLFHPEIEVLFRSADDDSQLQADQIAEFVKEGVDLIIVSPNEAEGLSEVIRSADARGIPVLVFDRKVDSRNYRTYLELDNTGLGRAAGEYMGNLTGGNADVIEIRGLEGSSPAAERHAGFMEGISGMPGIRVVASEAGDWNSDRAYRLADSLLELHPETDAFYAHNDTMALGISRALKARGAEGVRILGTDGTPSLGMRAVKEGRIDATFIYPTMGDMVLRTATDILEGKPVARNIHIPALTAVDKSNVDILLRQDELLREETSKLMTMKRYHDLSEQRRRSQIWLNVILGAVLAAGIAGICLLVKLIRQKVRYQELITEKNKMLEHERDKQKELYRQLDEATNAKLVFFTNVSHDLRTPLTLITGAIDQLASTAPLTEAERPIVVAARKNASILRRLIDEVLDFRKYQGGKLSLQPSEVPVVPMVQEWTEAFRSLARKRDIDLSFHAAPELPRSVAFDALKIERVFYNLLSNAFKYSPDNSRITVSLSSHADTLYIKVADNGIGISPEEQARIFDRFYQVNQIRPTGSGIGLSLAKVIAEMHDGALTVESEKGKGSVFTLALPIRHMDMEAEGVASSVQPGELALSSPFSVGLPDAPVIDAAKPLVLAVDDNPDILLLVSRILGDACNVVTVSNPRTGLKLAAKYVPDLIILDIMMPDIDGIELCGMLKRETATSHIPVLMLTACRLDEQRAQSYSNGADGYVSKPFDVEVLRTRCSSLIENRVRIRKHLLESAPQAPAPEGAATQRAGGNPLERESDFYRRFMETVEAHHTDSRTTTDKLAAELGLSGTQLTRKIKALSNYSPIEILKKYRLQKARRLMAATDKGISEIAYEVGFTSPPYLTKCFKDTYGQTPSEYRASLG